MDFVVASGEDLHDNGWERDAKETDGEMERKCLPEFLMVKKDFLWDESDYARKDKNLPA